MSGQQNSLPGIPGPSDPPASATESYFGANDPSAEELEALGQLGFDDIDPGPKD